MNRRGFSAGLFFFTLLFNVISANAQDEKFKAIFIYNFTKYINWPVKQGNFVICVMGSDDILPEIQSIAGKKMVGTANIEVIKVSTPSEIKNCSIIYLPQNKSEMLAQVVQMARDGNILIITEKPNSCSSGACINFITINGKLTFEISRSNIENYGLKVNSELLKLGTSLN